MSNVDWRKLPRPYRKTGNFIYCIKCNQSFYCIKALLPKIKYCSHKCYWQDRKDKKMLPPSQKGKKHTKIWKKYMSKMMSKKMKEQFQNGRKPIRYWLGKKRLDMTGINHWFWIDDRLQVKSKRHMAETNWWRKQVFERDNYTCVSCKQRGGKLNADHIKSWALYPNLRWNMNNGRTLCEKCHKETKTYGRRISYYA